MRRTDLLILGGGPAGAATAILLATGGKAPLLLERSRDGHDVVCGGFISADAITMLGRLGVDPAMLGAHRIGRVRLIAGSRIAEADLPFPAAGLSRRTLDAALLARAASAGAGIERGVTVRHIDSATHRIDIADGAMLTPETVFLATGKHDVRGTSRPADAAGSDPAIGLRIRLTPSPALVRVLDGMIELHLFDRGYAGLLAQEDGGINLCLSIAQSRLTEAGRKPEQLMALLAQEAPLLGERLGSATSAGLWSSIARIPYGWQARTATPGLFRLGDQAAVIASLAGDGIAVALASAFSASKAWTGGGDAPAWQNAFADRAQRPVRLAGGLKMIAGHPRIARPIVSLLSLFPGLIRHAAMLTRISTE